MSKKLIIDYLPFKIEPEQITESIKENNGRVIVSGILQRADARNQNNRFYPKRILSREAKKYTENYISENRAMGELDHPESTVVNLKNVSHHVIEMNWKGDELHGKVEILGTPSGQILKELLKSNVRLGISSRGVGSVKKIQVEGEDDADEIQEDFELIAFDFVSNPSTHKAFMNKVDESYKGTLDNLMYNKIDNLITDILCDLNIKF